MSNFLTEFQETRSKYNQLRGQAEKAMQSEFNEAIGKAAEIYKSYADEFGGKLKLPASVTRFVVNTTKTRKPRTPKTATTPAAAPTTNTPEPTETTAPQNGRKVAGLKKSFKSLTDKIATAKAEGKATRELEDKLYQVTDELRLAGITMESTPAETPAPVTTMAAPPQPPSLGPVHPF